MLICLYRTKGIKTVFANMFFPGKGSFEFGAGSSVPRRKDPRKGLLKVWVSGGVHFERFVLSKYSIDRPTNEQGEVVGGHIMQ